MLQKFMVFALSVSLTLLKLNFITYTHTKAWTSNTNVKPFQILDKNKRHEPPNLEPPILIGT